MAAVSSALSDQQLAYTLVELLASTLFATDRPHCNASTFCALACCSRSLREVTSHPLLEARRHVANEMRARIGRSAWGKSCCCRKGATRLSLNGDPVTVELPGLLRYVSASGVLDLKLRNICLGIHGMRTVASAAACGALDGLRVLVLSHNFINDACVEELTETALRRRAPSCTSSSIGFPHLRTLNLSSNLIGDRGLRALCEAALPGRALAALSCLRIAANPDISAERIHMLAGALSDGAFHSLAELVVPQPHERNGALSGACRARSVKLV